jgi:hypothetical protein
MTSIDTPPFYVFFLPLGQVINVVYTPTDDNLPHPSQGSST